MNEQSPSMPPPIAVKPKRKWRWLKITLGVIAAVVLVLRLLNSVGGSQELEVRRSGAFLANDALALEILNVGSKPITVARVTVNDRSDCKISRLSWTDNTNPLPAALKVGEKIMLASSCQVIRVAVETDQGSLTYSFTGE